ncbi:MAG: hypothetical protein M3345_02225 [Actinomycetota bacterium]|nr:hypothetical protein [Actinomycetota bacterium]
MRRSAAFVLCSFIALLGPLSGVAEACSSGGGEGCGSGALVTWDQPYYMPGEVAHGTAEVSWTRRTRNRAASPADGPFAVYLRPLRPGLSAWPQADPAALLVGRVQASRSERGRFGTATIELVIPQVPKGRYLVQHCNAGCRLKLGNLVDGTITVVTTEAEERALIDRRMNQLRRGMGNIGARLSRAQHAVRKAIDRAEDAAAVEDIELDARVDAVERKLEGELAALRRSLDRKNQSPNVSTVAGGGILLVLMAALGWKLRRDSPLG